MNKKVLVIACAALAVSLAAGKIKKNSAKFSFVGEPSNKAQLGEVLFFEKKLSADQSLNCASCHIPEHGFADTVAFSRGVGGRLGKRNAPGCTNLSDRPYLFFDGRAASLEDQVRFPIQDHNEMDLNIEDAVRRLDADSHYVSLFRKIWGTRPSAEKLQASIAAFERTLETTHTPFDRYMNGNEKAISESAKRGRELFMSDKMHCFDCHFSPDFTGDEFRNIGLFDGRKFNDSGRYGISRKQEDLGKFKVPGLRNVSVTGPYMHNGMFTTLRQVIDYYDDPYKVVSQPINIDSALMKPLHMTEAEKQDLEAFLLTLTDDRFLPKKGTVK